MAAHRRQIAEDALDLAKALAASAKEKGDLGPHVRRVKHTLSRTSTKHAPKQPMIERRHP